MDKPMSEKEVKRVQALDKLNKGKISQQQAAKQMCTPPVMFTDWPIATSRKG